MPLKPEAKVLAAILRHLKQMKSAGEPVSWLKLHGGSAQRMGEPDLHITWKGQSYWIEVKAPGQKPTDLQVHRLSAWRAAGAITGWTASLDEFVRILNGELKPSGVPAEAGE